MRAAGIVLLLAAATLAPAPVATATPCERKLRAEIVVPAPRSAVWRAWTTEAGVTTFLAPAARVEARVDGAYEMYFDPSAPEGSRGGEGLRILAFEPEERLVFTWNAPPSIPSVRGQRTVVTVRLADDGAERTRLVFEHTGWGEGEDWDRAFAYFDRAWSRVVLPFLIHRFAHGPVDWSAPPSVEPVAETLRVEDCAQR